MVMVMRNSINSITCISFSHTAIRIVYFKSKRKEKRNESLSLKMQNFIAFGIFFLLQQMKTHQLPSFKTLHVNE